MNAYSIYSFDFIENESRMEEYVKAITSVKPEGPYILFGYSAGGNLAFEVAKVLIETGHHVSDIIFLDSAKSFVLIEEESEDAKKLAEQQDKEFIEENEKLIKGMFGDNQAVIEKAIERMRNYHKYTRSVINSGQINSISILLYHSSKTMKVKLIYVKDGERQQRESSKYITDLAVILIC